MCHETYKILSSEIMRELALTKVPYLKYLKRVVPQGLSPALTLGQNLPARSTTLLTTHQRLCAMQVGDFDDDTTDSAKLRT